MRPNRNYVTTDIIDEGLISRWSSIHRTLVAHTCNQRYQTFYDVFPRWFRVTSKIRVDGSTSRQPPLPLRFPRNVRICRCSRSVCTCDHLLSAFVNLCPKNWNLNKINRVGGLNSRRVFLCAFQTTAEIPSVRETSKFTRSYLCWDFRKAFGRTATETITFLIFYKNKHVYVRYNIFHGNTSACISESYCSRVRAV